MSASEHTWYEILDVSPSATYEELEIAWQKMLRDNAPEDLPPFSRALAMKKVKDANVAWAVLRDWDARLGYHEKIGVQLEDQQRLKESYRRKKDQQPKSDDQAENDSRPQVSTPFSRSPSSSSSSSSSDEDSANWADEEPPYPEGATRYATTDIGTEIHILISKWRLNLHLSSKFKFLNDVSELSNRHEDDSISFKISLAYTSDPGEAHDAIINELTVKVEFLPQERSPGSAPWGIARLQTVFKESISDMPSLTVTLSAGSLGQSECRLPWEFGFDFDLNEGVRSHRRGTCLIFSCEGFPGYFPEYVGVESAEYELKKDKDVRANMYKDLGDDKVLKMEYGRVTMWRLAAVGWRG
ncbi:hypothetical protein PMIN01_03773 [Paraphaeosphaeria minitans]|uniref:J domain-containing protein n=1 Tax=Paraphaeosphaeria minitans TaxID=565426 RepID=A0A9P6KTP5_9PLEO|nr:hypothetical protein PMIN01_03773 [Paraphaeosphaeria minitans]